MGNEGGKFPNRRSSNGGRWGGGAEIPPGNNGLPKKEVLNIFFLPLRIGLDYWFGAPKPRSLGRGADKPRKWEMRAVNF